MFIAVGILSILAGIFVFRQGTALSVLSNLAKSNAASTTSGAFLLVAICLLIAGVFSCACKGGEKRGLVRISSIMYLLGAMVAFVYSVGDLQLWCWVCLALGIIYIIWLFRHKKVDKEEKRDKAEP